MFNRIIVPALRVNGISLARLVVLDQVLFTMAYRFGGPAQYTAYDHADARTAIDWMKANVLNARGDGQYFCREMKWANLWEKSAFDQALYGLTAPLTDIERNPPPMTYEETMLGFNNDRYITITAPSLSHARQIFNRIAMGNQGYGWGIGSRIQTGVEGIGFYGNFGDGLPLVPPTRELVNEMLAGSERGRFPDDIVGYLKLQGGAMTVEKIAINAVMAGARPEHFPVILAAMELFAATWEYDMMWYHGLSTGSNSTLYMMLNGPLGKELGVSGAEGSHAGAGQEINNIIGRAIRMNFRNMGHMTLEIDDHQYRGREHDFTLIFFREQEEYLPGWDPAVNDPIDSWRPYHVEMGFRPEESTITIWAGPSRGGAGAFGGEPAFWTNAAASAFSGAGIGAQTVDFTLVSPGMAYALFTDHGHRNKDSIRDMIGSAGFPFPTLLTHRSVTVNPIVAGGDLAAIRGFAGSGNYRNNCHQINLISGATLTEHGRAASIFDVPHRGVFGDPSGSHVFITDPARLDPTARTPAPNGAWLPSLPRNIQVTYSEINAAPGRTHVTVSWEAPACNGNTPIIAYQISFDHGGLLHFHTVTDTSSTVTPGTGIVAPGVVNLLPAPDNFNSVRASYSRDDHIWAPEGHPQYTLGYVPASGINVPHHPIVQTSGANRIYSVGANTRSITFMNMPADFEAFFRVRAINGLRNALNVDATATIGGIQQSPPASPNNIHSLGGMLNFGGTFHERMTARSSGRGAWAPYVGTDGSQSQVVSVNTPVAPAVVTGAIEGAAANPFVSARVNLGHGSARASGIILSYDGDVFETGVDYTFNPITGLIRFSNIALRRIADGLATSFVASVEYAVYAEDEDAGDYEYGYEYEHDNDQYDGYDYDSYEDGVYDYVDNGFITYGSDILEYDAKPAYILYGGSAEAVVEFAAVVDYAAFATFEPFAGTKAITIEVEFVGTGVTGSIIINYDDAVIPNPIAHRTNFSDVNVRTVNLGSPAPVSTVYINFGGVIFTNSSVAAVEVGGIELTRVEHFSVHPFLRVLQLTTAGLMQLADENGGPVQKNTAAPQALELPIVITFNDEFETELSYVIRVHDTRTAP